MDSTTLWVVVGLLGQACFSARFLVQWLVSERQHRSVLPDSFWYFSLGGGIILLAYAIYLGDPVFILGQVSGLAIYGRNIWLSASPSQGGGRDTLAGRDRGRAPALVSTKRAA